MDKMRQIELELMKPSIPDFNVGDTVDVHYLIKEGDKERVQLFTGTVMGFHGAGIRRSVLVRRLVAGEGVERVFPLHSPRVQDIKVKSKGRVRRAKLFYLRDRVGKAVKLRGTFGKQRGARSVGDLPKGKKGGATKGQPQEAAAKSAETQQGGQRT